MKKTALILTVLLFACETREHVDAELGALKKAKAAARASNARVNGSQSQQIGVAECDAYVRNYESCLNDKVPDDKRDALRTTLDDNRRKWQDAVTAGTDQAQIADQCKSAVTDASAKMSEYGCSW